MPANTKPPSFWPSATKMACEVFPLTSNDGNIGGPRKKVLRVKSKGNFVALATHDLPAHTSENIVMKFGIFGDIHGNLEAFEAVLEDMQAQCVKSTVCVAARGDDAGLVPYRERVGTLSSLKRPPA